MRRIVTAAVLRSVRGSLLGPDTPRRMYAWDLTLDCGHVVCRRARYRRSTQPARRTGGWKRRPRADVRPAPAYVYCEECRSLERRPHAPTAPESTEPA